jgi:tRNA A-37 threonylcarbamoyl transferase component Bud32
LYFVIFFPFIVIDAGFVVQVAKRLKLELTGATNCSNMSDSEFTKYVEELQEIRIEKVAIVEGLPSVLTDDEQRLINNAVITTEHYLIVLLTKTLVSLCREAGLNFVNTEEGKWIHTLLEHAENYQKPDGSSSIDNIFEMKPAHRMAELGPLREEQNSLFLFGCPHWELKDFYLLWEFKLRISPQDRGVAYSYICHVSRADETNLYTCILGDTTDFYIVKGRNGMVTKVMQGKWNASGSRKALLDVCRSRNPSLRLLIALCAQLQVTPTAFLGAGKYGRCFAVRGPDNVLQVLKTVRTMTDADRCVVEQEYTRLTTAPLLTDVAVVKVVENSLRSVFEEGRRIGMGYLMRDVGEPLNPLKCKETRGLLRKLILSLQSLHLRGIAHGDARVYNIVLKEDVVIWVDFVAFDGTFTGVAARRDMRELIHSVYNDGRCDSSPLRELLEEYSSGMTNIDGILTALAA